MDAIELGNKINKLIKQARPGWTTWDQWCEKEAWYGQWAGGIPEANIPVFASAIAHARAAKIISTDPNAAVAGGRVYWDIGQFGHTGTALGNGYFMNTSARTKGSSVHNFEMGLFISKIADYTRLTGARYLGSTAADFALTPYGSSGPIAGNQRRAKGIEANRRATPDRSQAPLPNPVPANEVGTFDGWIYGENVDGNNVWFRGAFGDHNWFWSGGFTDAGVHDLQDMNPVAPPTSSSRVTKVAANARDAAKTSGNLKTTVAAGQPVEMAGFVHGDSVTQSGVTSDVWFVTKVSGYYMWAGSFTSQSVDGLSVQVTPVDPPVVTDPGSTLNTDYKSFTADSPLATWVGSPNFGKRPATKKDHITLHWMSGTLAGTDAEFQKIPTNITPAIVNGRSMGVATTYGVGPNAIHQYVKENEYHHGDGDAVSNASGIAIEHEGGPNIPIADATYENSIKLVADIAKRLELGVLVLGVNVFPHSHWAATACPGTLDMQRIVDGANKLNAPIDNGDGGETGEGGDPETPGSDDETPGWFVRFLNGLIEFFKSFLGSKG